MTPPHHGTARPPRIVTIAAVAAALYAWAIFATTKTYHGSIGPDYDTLGTDYMAMHTGIVTALRGDMALLFDPDRFTALLNQLYHAVLPFPLIARPWVYPPSFLILLLPFASFAFLPSYVLFQIVTAALLGVALCAGRKQGGAYGLVAVLALCSPSASVNWLEGQVAFLVAALLIGGTRALPARPILAGVLFGLLSVKPQHALMVPVMLVALGAWRTVLAACVTALALAAASALIFGVGSWTAWVNAILHYPSIDSVWDNSVHTCAILLGAGSIGAAVAQGLALAGGGWIVLTVFRRPASAPVRLAVLLAATNLVSPHTGPYDTIYQVIAAGVLLIDIVPAPPPLLWILGLCIWLVPLLSQPVVSPIARFEPLLTAVLLFCLFVRLFVRRDEAGRAGGAVPAPPDPPSFIGPRPNN